MKQKGEWIVLNMIFKVESVRIQHTANQLRAFLSAVIVSTKRPSRCCAGRPGNRDEIVACVYVQARLLFNSRSSERVCVCLSFKLLSRGEAWMS